MRRTDEDDYRSYVVARQESLRRMAYLLCRDWHLADDLVSICLAKLYHNWSRAKAAQNMDAYIRGILTNAWLDERRRPWRRERSTARPPEDAVSERRIGAVSDRDELWTLLDGLPRRQRAVVVLRFYCDLSVEETAQILGIAPGTVKSQSAKALAVLRAAMDARTAMDIQTLRSER